MSIITAPVAGTISLPLDGVSDLPAWPANLPEPVVTLTYPLNAVEATVEINGDTVRFWRWGGHDRVSNSVHDGLHFRAADRPWFSLRPSDREAALNWGASVHRRAEHALVVVGETLATESAAAAAILGYVTGKEQAPTSSEDSSAVRMDAALALWPDSEDGPQSRIQDVLADVRHYCKTHGLDLEAALAGSVDAFASESGSPYFTYRS